MTQIFNRSSEKWKRQELRNRKTPAEKVLWQRLRRKQMMGLMFRQQASIGPYIADFYCARARLAIEVDGGYHNTEAMRTADELRDAYFGSLGLKVLRFTNQEVECDIESVVKRIHTELQALRVGKR